MIRVNINNVNDVLFDADEFVIVGSYIQLVRDSKSIAICNQWIYAEILEDDADDNF